MQENLGSNDCRFGLLVVFSSDVEKAADFYRAIGLRLVRHAHPPCGEHYSTVGSECVFEIYPRRNASREPSPMTFGFRVPSVDRAIEAAVVHGGSVKRKPCDDDWGRSATVVDPDGHSVLLMEPARGAA